MGKLTLKRLILPKLVNVSSLLIRLKPPGAISPRRHFSCEAAKIAPHDLPPVLADPDSILLRIILPVELHEPFCDVCLKPCAVIIVLPVQPAVHIHDVSDVASPQVAADANCIEPWLCSHD